MLFRFEKIHVKLETVLIETVLSEDPLYNFGQMINDIFSFHISY